LIALTLTDCRRTPKTWASTWHRVDPSQVEAVSAMERGIDVRLRRPAYLGVRCVGQCVISADCPAIRLGGNASQSGGGIIPGPMAALPRQALVCPQSGHLLASDIAGQPGDLGRRHRRHTSSRESKLSARLGRFRAGDGRQRRASAFGPQPRQALLFAGNCKRDVVQSAARRTDPVEVRVARRHSRHGILELLGALRRWPWNRGVRQLGCRALLAGAHNPEKWWAKFLILSRRVGIWARAEQLPNNRCVPTGH